MRGTILLLRLPAASPLLAGPKIPKPRDRMPFLQVNTYLTSPTPLLFPSCSNPRHATIPIATSVSDVSFPSAASFTLKTRWKLGSKPLPNPLQSGSEPLVAGDDGVLEDAGELRRLVIRVGEALSMAFPLWVSLACLLALWKPPTFLWVGRTWQIVGLTLTMLGMGMTLTLDDLRTALLMPRELAAGFVLQYTVMPMSGYLFSKLLKLPSYYAAGLILVACCPGGTASNIVTYLARGNVALSVLMTATSTFTAAVMTPFLTSKLAGQFVAVDPLGLFISTVQVVLTPVLLGTLLNQYCNKLVRIVSPVMPFIAVATVAILCGSAIAQNASSILSSGSQVVLSVFALHASGFLFGYLLSKLLGIDDSSARTISIEVGMQNSVLGVVLAGQHFGNPLTAVPCAVSSICHSVYGSALAGVWRSMPDGKVDN